MPKITSKIIRPEQDAELTVFKKIINDAEISTYNDPTILQPGTYVLNKQNDLYKTKEGANILLSIREGLPDIRVYGEQKENPFKPHVKTLSNKEITSQLEELQATYIMTVESYGKNETVLRSDENVTISSSSPNARIRIYGLFYTALNNEPGVKDFEIEDKSKISEITQRAGISIDRDGLYHITRKSREII